MFMYTFGITVTGQYYACKVYYTSEVYFRCNERQISYEQTYINIEIRTNKHTDIPIDINGQNCGQTYEHSTEHISGLMVIGTCIWIEYH